MRFLLSVLSVSSTKYQRYFFEDLTQLVERISAEAKEAHFVGDFNIDLLLRNDSNSRRLKYLMENFG